MLFSLILMILLTIVSASGQNYVWVKQYEGSSPANAYGISLDESGNIFTMGWFDGIVDFDPGPGVYNLTAISARDVFINKLDPSGNFLWAKQLSGTGNERGYGITIDQSGNVYT